MITVAPKIKSIIIRSTISVLFIIFTIILYNKHIVLVQEPKPDIWEELLVSATFGAMGALTLGYGLVCILTDYDNSKIQTPNGFRKINYMTVLNKLNDNLDPNMGRKLNIDIVENGQNSFKVTIAGILNIADVHMLESQCEIIQATLNTEIPESKMKYKLLIEII